jgi:hypothetical protein
MKNLLLVAVFASFVAGCNSGKPADQTGTQNNTTAAPQKASAPDPNAPSYQAVSPDDAEVQKILGSYVGPFGDNKITLLITKAAGGTVSGRTIVGGNDRPFEGTYSVENAVYSVEAREPGDHKDDGVFKFSVSASDPSEVKGTWKANDTKRPEKSYVLARRKFEYRTNVGNWPEASTRLLKTADVENLPKDELEFMRNEIFARHGYCFAKKHLRQQFENEDWYVPNTVDIRGYLTDIEKKNIALIKRYEKYAEEYGDEFGR